MLPSRLRGPLAVLFSLLLFACGGSAAMAEYASEPKSAGSEAPMAMSPAPEAPSDSGGDFKESMKKDEMSAAPGSSFGSGGESMRRETKPSDLDSRQPTRGPPAQKPPAGGPAKALPGANDKAGGAVQVQSPMLIYTAELTMAVFEVAQSLAAIEVAAREAGGFLSKRDDTSITIRVPSARFDDTVARLEKLGDMIHRNVTAQDVTEEFMDLDVRLKNARAIRERLEQLLAKAAKVEESILIERELGRVAGEIERIEGRMKFLRDRAAFSTITVMFQPRKVENLTPSKTHLPVPWLYEMGLGRLLNL